MDDEELREALKAIEGRAIVAQGEALFAGMMIGGVVPILLQNGSIDRKVMELLIDSALLTLEKRRHPMNEGDRRMIDHARTRLEGQRSILKLDQPSSPSEETPTA